MGIFGGFGNLRYGNCNLYILYFCPLSIICWPQISFTCSLCYFYHEISLDFLFNQSLLSGIFMCRSTVFTQIISHLYRSSAIFEGETWPPFSFTHFNIFILAKFISDKLKLKILSLFIKLIKSYRYLLLYFNF